MVIFRTSLLSLVAVVLLATAEGEQEISGNLLVACGIAFSLLIAAGIGFPIPEELPIVMAGIWAGHQSDLGAARFLILPVCILGVVISDGLLYGIGRYFGPKLLENRWMKRLLPPNKRERIEDNFRKYGVLTLLFARFLPAIRSPIFVTAGVMRLSLTRFLFADGIYAIPGVSLLFSLSYWFGDQFQELVMHAEEKVIRIRPLLILLVIAAVAGFLAYHFLRRPVAIGDPQELPLIGERVAEKMEHPQPAAPQPSADGVAGANQTTEAAPPAPSSPESPGKT